MGATLYADRRDAGRKLAARLQGLSALNPIVVGLPRGGVPVAYEVADALGAPLDIVVVRKLGAPFHAELGVGALAEGGIRVLSGSIVQALGLDAPDLEEITRRERAELQRRVRRYRGERLPRNLAGRTAILVDDGIATGVTASAGARALRRRGARRVILAVPVAPPGAEARFVNEVDDFICLEAPTDFFAVGAYYEHFDQVGDAEVAALLAKTQTAVTGRAREAAEAPRVQGGIDWSRARHREVAIPSEAGTVLRGDLRLPPSPAGLVVFAHGSGSSRLSPRNVQVAAALGASGFATLLLDLLSEPEAAGGKVFDIPLLAGRLVDATRWAAEQPELGSLPIGYFGASTGAAAALCAAADLDGGIGAVVSRGGRPDLAVDRLHEVTAPTLFIVGGADTAVIELNEEAQALLHCANRLVIVPGATHLFEQSGALELVAQQAAQWFGEHLAPTKPSPSNAAATR
jgi:putative phosphoribosyl transferase